MGIQFGNLSVEDIEKRLGITLSNEERIAMKEIHSNVADMPFGTWHCFDMPFILVCNGSDTANIVTEILRPYSGRMICPMQIGVNKTETTMQVYKSVAIKGYMVEFYHKEGDKKLSFRIQDNEKLTDVLLAHCSTKRVNVDSIEYAIRGIREKIEQGILDPASVQTRGPQVTSEDYCTKINLYAQKEHGESVCFRVHPRGYETEVILSMPDCNVFRAVASNKKLAKQLAAKKACEYFEI